MTAAGQPGEHRAFEDMAVAHVLGGLDSEQGRLFRSHLLDCADCRARVGELRAIAHDLAGVERDAQREQTAQAVDTKKRKREQTEQLSATRPRPGASRVLLIVTLAGFIALVAYVAMLRTNIAELERAVEAQQAMSVVLEHGDTLPVTYRAPGVSATAKLRGEQVVLVLEGLTDERPYGVFLLDEDDSVVFRRHDLATNGRLFALLTLSGPEDRLIVTDPESAFSSEPDGTSIFEAPLERQEDHERAATR